MLPTGFRSAALRLAFPTARPLAVAGLARSENRAPLDDHSGMEAKVREARQAPVSAPPSRRNGLSLPVRAWLIVGAAAALWGLIALGIALL